MASHPCHAVTVICGPCIHVPVGLSWTETLITLSFFGKADPTDDSKRAERCRKNARGHGAVYSCCSKENRDATVSIPPTVEQSI